MAKVIVDKDVLSSVPSNLDSVVDELLESARKQLQKAQDIFLNNKKVKNNISSIKIIDTLVSDTKDVSESVTATRAYTAKMVSLIDKYEEENKMTDKEMGNFANDLIGDQAILTAATGAVTVESVESSPWYAKMWDGIKSFASGAWDLIKDVGATIATIFNSLLKGLTKLVEDVVDAAAFLGGALVTGGAWLGDLVFGTNTHEDIWNGVQGFIATDWVGDAWDSFYKKTPVGQWLCDNSWMNPQGTAANVIAGVGEVVGILAISAVCPPAGAAVAGGSAFGQSTELSAQNGDSFGKALLKGGVSALVSVALMNGVGGKVASKLTSIGGKVTSKVSSLATKVAGSKGVQLLKNTGGAISSGVKNLVGKVGNTWLGRGITKVGSTISSGAKSLANKISGTKVGQMLSKTGSKISTKCKSLLNKINPKWGHGKILAEKTVTKDGVTYIARKYADGTSQVIEKNTGKLAKIKGLFSKTGSKTGSNVTSGVTKVNGKTVYTSVGSNPGTALSVVEPGAVSTNVVKAGSSVASKISAKGLARAATASVGYGLAMDKSETPSNTSQNNGNGTNGETSPSGGSSSSSTPTPSPSDDSSSKKKKTNNNNKNKNKNKTAKHNSNNSSKRASSSSSSNSSSSSQSSSNKNNSSASSSKTKKSNTNKLKSTALIDDIQSSNNQNEDTSTSVFTPNTETDDSADSVIQPVETPVEDITPIEDNTPVVNDTPIESNASNEAVATPVEDNTSTNSTPTATYYSSNSTSTAAAPVTESAVSATENVAEATEVPSETEVDVSDEEVTTTPTKKVTKTLDVDDTETSSNKHSGNVAIPIGLGLAGAGAAAVAGARYIKNKKNSEEYDENYDDENNQLDYESGSSDSEYMDDNYLGPSGSSYTDTTGLEDVTSDDFVPDDNSYTDASDLESDEDNLENDIVFNELNTN